MKKLLTLLVLLLQMNALSAQQENVWAFGQFAGINFNSGTPVPFTTAISDGTTFMEASASVCGANGRLLFYTEGSSVWDSTHALMPSGTDLTGMGSGGNVTSSTAQGALIVPMPDSSHKYYIFSLTDFSNEGKLYYSVVDMNLNNGKGDIVPGQKGIFVDSALTEKMTAVPGSSCSAWVIVSSKAGAIKAFKVDLSGVSTTPVTSPGISLGSDQGLEPIGTMAASPDGTMLVETRMDQVSNPVNVALYDFNPVTGIASNPLSLVTDTACFGACFSPDNTKVYIASTSPSILQFDLSSGNPALIPGTLFEAGACQFITQLKCGPDGKIYFLESGSSLGRIGSPNLAGAACAYTAAAITLQPGTNGGFGLPNAVPVLHVDSLLSSHAVVVCNGDSTTLTADSSSGWGYTWNDGTTGPDKEVTTAGTYWVTYRASCRLQTDTFVVTKVTLGAVITVSGLTLSTTQPYATYQWLLNGTAIAGAISNTHTAAVNGHYSVVVHDANGCSDTSNVIEVKNVGIDDPGGIAQQISIYPNPAGKEIRIQSPVPVNVAITGLEGKRISYAENGRSLSVAALAEGVYLLHITDSKGFLLKVEKLVIAR